MTYTDVTLLEDPLMRGDNLIAHLHNVNAQCSGPQPSSVNSMHEQEVRPGPWKRLSRLGRRGLLTEQSQLSRVSQAKKNLTG